MKTYETVDDYILQQTEAHQKLLKRIRKELKKAIPGVSEAIKYGMPTLVYHGNLLHYAAQKKHIGYYPAPSGVSNFEKELSPYHTSKGAIQFPYDKPLPIDLIVKIALFRAKENKEKAQHKK